MNVINKRKFTVSIGIGSALVTVLAARLVWGRAAPVLGISHTTNNAVSLNVTNGVSNGRYQIYWAEFLGPNAEWLLLTNGSVGQTQFVSPMGDLETGFFRAVSNTNFVLPSINVIILSPTNGTLIQ